MWWNISYFPAFGKKFNNYYAGADWYKHVIYKSDWKLYIRICFVFKYIRIDYNNLSILPKHKLYLYIIIFYDFYAINNVMYKEHLILVTMLLIVYFLLPMP